MNKEDNKRRAALIYRDVYDKDLDWFEKQELLRLQNIISAEIVEDLRPQMYYIFREVMQSLFLEKTHGLRESAIYLEEYDDS